MSRLERAAIFIFMMGVIGSAALLPFAFTALRAD